MQGALTGLETCALAPRSHALLRFVAKVNHNSPRIGLEDMSPLHEARWSDEAIYFAITVCALFKFYNGWIDAAGVHASTARAPRSTATPETRA